MTVINHGSRLSDASNQDNMDTTRRVLGCNIHTTIYTTRSLVRVVQIIIIYIYIYNTARVLCMRARIVDGSSGSTLCIYVLYDSYLNNYYSS